MLLLIFMAYFDFFYFKFLLTGDDQWKRGYWRTMIMAFRQMLLTDLTEEVDEFTGTEWLIFVLFFFVIFIILLNLLIAVVGDSYERVMSSYERSKGHHTC